MINIIPTRVGELNKLLDGEVICGAKNMATTVEAFATSDRLAMAIELSIASALQ